MLLGIPGDNTYSNYAEANRAFYRQTVVQLVIAGGNAQIELRSGQRLPGAPFRVNIVFPADSLP